MKLMKCFQERKAHPWRSISSIQRDLVKDLGKGPVRDLVKDLGKDPVKALSLEMVMQFL